MAYGVPCFFWLTSLSDPDPKYKRVFANTFLWLPTIFCFLTFLIVTITLVVLNLKISDVPLIVQLRVFAFAAIATLVYFLPNYFLVFKSLIAYADQTPEKPAEALPAPDNSELTILILKPY